MQENLVFENASENNLDEIMELYKRVIKTTFTTWDENYPSRELIEGDIKNKELFVIKSKDKIVAVSFLGAKEKDNEKWCVELKKPIGIARICVAPECQGKGIGAFLVKSLIQRAKNQGADGMHFHVEVSNISAMKMYEKCGFKNYGRGQSNYGYDYYKYELKF